ncbi:hypothetical protein N9A04_00720 [Rickettsiales bacterium]|nr:hypothetical protein [Rickettsiales bacterium]
MKIILRTLIIISYILSTLCIFLRTFFNLFHHNKTLTISSLISSLFLLFVAYLNTEIIFIFINKKVKQFSKFIRSSILTLMTMHLILGSILLGAIFPICIGISDICKHEVKDPLGFIVSKSGRYGITLITLAMAAILIVKTMQIFREEKIEKFTKFMQLPIAICLTAVLFTSFRNAINAYGAIFITSYAVTSMIMITLSYYFGIIPLSFVYGKLKKSSSHDSK